MPGRKPFNPDDVRNQTPGEVFNTEKIIREGSVHFTPEFESAYLNRAQELRSQGVKDEVVRPINRHLRDEAKSLMDHVNDFGRPKGWDSVLKSGNQKRMEELKAELDEVTKGGELSEENKKKIEEIKKEYYERMEKEKMVADEEMKKMQLEPSGKRKRNSKLLRKLFGHDPYWVESESKGWTDVGEKKGVKEKKTEELLKRKGISLDQLKIGWSPLGGSPLSKVPSDKDLELSQFTFLNNSVPPKPSVSRGLRNLTKQAVKKGQKKIKKKTKKIALPYWGNVDKYKAILQENEMWDPKDPGFNAHMTNFLKEKEAMEKESKIEKTKQYLEDIKKTRKRKREEELDEMVTNIENKMEGVPQAKKSFFESFTSGVGNYYKKMMDDVEKENKKDKGFFGRLWDGIKFAGKAVLSPGLAVASAFSNSYKGSDLETVAKFAGNFDKRAKVFEKGMDIGSRIGKSTLGYLNEPDDEEED